MKSPDPLLGSVIDGRYHITARLARGGMATVYRATDTRLERTVAVKLIHPHLAEKPDFVDRFIREARAAAQLSSPRIVAVHDQGIAYTAEGERAYLVMELVNGPNLRTELNSHGSFPLGVALGVTAQVLEGLAAAHNKGLVHRDVKPENILLASPIESAQVVERPEINAKVADFGLARAVTAETATQTGMMLGTVAYVAPEIVSEGNAGAPSDVYSTGIMLYELLAGKLPFTGETSLNIAYAHVNKPMPRLADEATWIPTQVDSLIALLTAKDPHKRPVNAAFALEALNDVVASIPEELLIRRIPVFPATPALEPTRQLADTEEASAPPAQQAPVSPTQILTQETQTVPAKETRAARPRRNRKGRLVSLLFLLVLLAGAAYGIYWYFAEGPGQRVAVVDVVDTPLDDAKAALIDSGFSIEVAHEYSDTVPKGDVISTDPMSGARIHPDTTVTITVSDGVEHVTVPDVVGKPQVEAEEILNDGRLNVEITEDWSEDVAKGNVISQEPAAAESVPHSSTTTITVSKGREPIAAPLVTGLDRDAAVTALENLGLKAEISSEYSDEVTEGVVISQGVPVDTTLYRGDAVKIVVSRGPELFEVPSVVGMSSERAKETLENAGFAVEIESGMVILDLVYIQNPSGGSMARPGTTITLTLV